MNRNAQLSVLIRSAVLIALFCFLTACASVAKVPTEPFVEFHESIAQLKVSSDRALGVEQQLVYQRYLEKWKSDGSIVQLQLLPSEIPVPFAMQMAEDVLFKDIQNSRAKLGALNSLILQYAQTLMLLAGASEGSPAVNADKLAGDLRTNANALATTLGSENEIADGFFFGFGLLANNYIENKRIEGLLELIQSSQDEIVSFSNFGRQITQVSGLGIQTEYSASFSKLTSGSSDLSESRRGEVIESVLALNEQTLRQLGSLKLIYEAYQSLPAAHLQLEQAVRDGTSLSFTELVAFAQSLKKRYETFEGDE